MLRGTIDPKEPPVYEYVKFIGNFKSLNNGELRQVVPEVCLSSISLDLISGRVCVCLSPVPNCTRNSFEGVIQRSLQSAFEDRVCLIATVRLAKPQFIKVSILVGSAVSRPAFHLLCTRSLPVKKRLVLMRTQLSGGACPVKHSEASSRPLLISFPRRLCWLGLSLQKTL